VQTVKSVISFISFYLPRVYKDE